MILNRRTARTLTKYGDSVWRSTKVLDVVLNPFKCQHLILETCVSRCTGITGIQETFAITHLMMYPESLQHCQSDAAYVQLPSTPRRKLIVTRMTSFSIKKSGPNKSSSPEPALKPPGWKKTITALPASLFKSGV